MPRYGMDMVERKRERQQERERRKGKGEQDHKDRGGEDTVDIVLEVHFTVEQLLR